MKSKLLTLLLLVSLFSFGQKLPITGLCLSDILTKTGGTCLSTAFTNANSAWFDPTYAVSGNCLNDFRNYGYTGCRPSGLTTYYFSTVRNGVTVTGDNICTIAAGTGGSGYTGQSYGTNGSYAYSGTATDCNYITDGFYAVVVGASIVARIEVIGGVWYNMNCSTVPRLTTASIGSITYSSASGGGDIDFNGGSSVTARGVCWNTSTNPTVSNSKTIDGSAVGSFSSSLTGLNNGTLYYVRAYATNSTGTGYGSNVTFTTTAGSLPTLVTGSLLGRTHNQIHTGGIISDEGSSSVTARGVCYSTTQSSPSLTNSSYTTDGTGAGIYDSYMNGLTGNTFYYWRAYATNSAGTAYGYSDYGSTLCSLSWSFISEGTGDKIEIFINGTAVVSTGSTSSGTISCAIGDAVSVTVDPGNRDYSEASLQINAATPQTDIQYTPALSNLAGTVSGNVVIMGSTHN